jgi:hypothetical protein
MDRLTHYDKNGSVYSTRGYEIALSRLAAYEDTGLTPEEVDNLCREMSEIRIALGITTFKCWRELAEAGQILVLPCKVGDTMWSSTLGRIRSFIVAGFEFYGNGLYVVEQIKLGRELRENGKTAHLTREVAEVVLEKREDKL